MGRRALQRVLSPFHGLRLFCERLMEDEASVAAAYDEVGRFVWRLWGVWRCGEVLSPVHGLRLFCERLIEDEALIAAAYDEVGRFVWGVWGLWRCGGVLSPVHGLRVFCERVMKDEASVAAAYDEVGELCVGLCVGSYTSFAGRTHLLSLVLRALATARHPLPLPPNLHICSACCPLPLQLSLRHARGDPVTTPMLDLVLRALATAGHPFPCPCCSTPQNTVTFATPTPCSCPCSKG